MSIPQVQPNQNKEMKIADSILFILDIYWRDQKFYIGPEVYTM